MVCSLVWESNVTNSRTETLYSGFVLSAQSTQCSRYQAALFIPGRCPFHQMEPIHFPVKQTPVVAIVVSYRPIECFQADDSWHPVRFCPLSRCHHQRTTARHGGDCTHFAMVPSPIIASLRATCRRSGQRAHENSECSNHGRQSPWYSCTLTASPSHSGPRRGPGLSMLPAGLVIRAA